MASSPKPFAYPQRTVSTKHCVPESRNFVASSLSKEAIRPWSLARLERPDKPARTNSIRADHGETRLRKITNEKWLGRKESAKEMPDSKGKR